MAYQYAAPRRQPQGYSTGVYQPPQGPQGPLQAGPGMQQGRGSGPPPQLPPGPGRGDIAPQAPYQYNQGPGIAGQAGYSSAGGGFTPGGMPGGGGGGGYSPWSYAPMAKPPMGPSPMTAGMPNPMAQMGGMLNGMPAPMNGPPPAGWQQHNNVQGGQADPNFQGPAMTQGSMGGGSPVGPQYGGMQAQVAQAVGGMSDAAMHPFAPRNRRPQFPGAMQGGIMGGMMGPGMTPPWMRRQYQGL